MLHLISLFRCAFDRHRMRSSISRCSSEIVRRLGAFLIKYAKIWKQKTFSFFNLNFFIERTTTQAKMEKQNSNKYKHQKRYSSESRWV